MKSIKELAWAISEEVYRKNGAISYSTLASFDREGWRYTPHLFDKLETSSLTFGSVVDTILTEGKEAFESKYIVCEFPSTSDTLTKMAKMLHEAWGSSKRSVNLIEDKYILMLANQFKYYTKWNDDSRIKTIRAGIETYYSLLNLAGDKVILSQDDFDAAMNCIRELKSNMYTKDFFYANPFNKSIEKLFQLKFRASYNGIELRCMFDLIKVDHTNKIIYPIDLKTTGKPEDMFQESFIQWRYMHQAQIYSYILSQVIKEDEYFKDFEIAPYQFIVINRFTLAPLIWEYDNNFSEEDTITPEGYKIRNWRKILPDLVYYLHTSNYRYSREAIENKGKLKINL